MFIILHLDFLPRPRQRERSIPNTISVPPYDTAKMRVNGVRGVVRGVVVASDYVEGLFLGFWGGGGRRDVGGDEEIGDAGTVGYELECQFWVFALVIWGRDGVFAIFIWAEFGA